MWRRRDRRFRPGERGARRPISLCKVCPRTRLCEIEIIMMGLNTFQNCWAARAMSICIRCLRAPCNRCPGALRIQGRNQPEGGDRQRDGQPVLRVYNSEGSSNYGALYIKKSLRVISYLSLK